MAPTVSWAFFFVCSSYSKIVMFRAFRLTKKDITSNMIAVTSSVLIMVPLLLALRTIPLESNSTPNSGLWWLAASTPIQRRVTSKFPDQTMLVSGRNGSFGVISNLPLSSSTLLWSSIGQVPKSPNPYISKNEYLGQVDQEYLCSYKIMKAQSKKIDVLCDELNIWIGEPYRLFRAYTLAYLHLLFEHPEKLHTDVDAVGLDHHSICSDWHTLQLLLVVCQWLSSLLHS